MTKRFSTRKIAALCLVAVLFFSLALPAFAEIVEQGYRQLRGDTPAPVAAQTGASSAQSATWTTPINPIRTNGNTKIAGFVRGSGSGATCTLSVGLYHKEPGSDTYTFLGLSKVQQVTMSTSALADGTLYQATTDLDADTRAAAYYDLRISQISTGTVTVIHYPYGSGVRPGE